MSTETILSRMMSEPAFADAVFSNAEKALTEYNLPANDLAKFTKLTRAQFEAMTPEERKSMVKFVMRHDVGNDPDVPNHNETILIIT